MLARLANLGIGHPRRVAILTIVAFLVLGVVGGAAPGSLKSQRDFYVEGSESYRFTTTVQDLTGATAETGILALVDGAPDSKPVAQTVELIKQNSSIATVDVPKAGTKSPMISANGKATLVAVRMKVVKEPDSVVDALQEKLREENLSTKVKLGGIDVAKSQMNVQSEKDLTRGEMFAFPILAILSLLLFRGIASLLPITVGGLAVLGSFAILRLVNVASEVSPFALNLVIGLGLGLAVDYSLFLVSRFREELGSGADQATAIRTTMRTAGVTVVFSALTVAAALACLLVFPQRFLSSMGVGGITVAFVAAAVSLTVLPGLFMLFGSRLGKVTPGPSDSGAWYRISHAVLKRPGIVAIATTILMLALAYPATHLKWAGVGPEILPNSQSSRVVSNRISKEFPNTYATPISVLAQGNSSEISTISKTQAAISKMRGVRPNGVSEAVRIAPGAWRFEVLPQDLPTTANTQNLVQEIRDLDTGFKKTVGGWPTEFHDQRHAISTKLPAAAAILFALTFVVLWLMTGSVILPVKALIMNTLTMAAAAGALVFAFQDGHLASWFGASKQDGIEQTNFLVLAATAFALSTDYGVFLLTRIKEARDNGASERESVAVGIQKTGSIVTAAALLLAVALGAFVTARIIFLKELGFGAAFAVLVDAFIVRTFLVTSLMGLLGRWNWWSPAPLRRLHKRIGISET